MTTKIVYLHKMSYTKNRRGFEFLINCKKIKREPNLKKQIIYQKNKIQTPSLKQELFSCFSLHIIVILI